MNAYIDDWLNKNLLRWSVQLQTLFIIKLCGYLGLIVNLPKSELEPGQIRQYVGILYDLQSGIALAPTERLIALESQIQNLVRVGGGSARE
jgi:hypothetical protein